MKKNWFLLLVLLISCVAFSQPGKKTTQPKQPTAQSDINKLMEEAMKTEGMSKEEQEQMKKMMKDIMPAMNEVNAKTADYPEFTNNKQLAPKKDVTRIAAMSKKTLAKNEVAAYATGLYNKMMAKADAAEMVLVKKIIAQTPKASDIGSATILAMLQGHPQASLALSIKAVMADPTNVNWQNNMAALLTQYGYPEQAMPVLRKLNTENPYNSSVLNNLGYAWFSLGETDSAKRYFTSSFRVNPYHPESKLCGGLITELNGDPIKANDYYEDAMENCPNPFAEQMLNNNNGREKLNNLDFEKIKRSIAIYEYFPKNYLPDVPLLSANVNDYTRNESIKAGYQKMIEELTQKIEDMNKLLGNDLDNLTKQGEDEFVKQMATANIKGLSFMSKPAVTVLRVLFNYNKQWHEKMMDEQKKMFEKITGWKSEMNKITSKNWKKEECHIPDDAKNKFMAKVNPMMRDFFLQKAEEQRQWINAWCTWNWYVSGNIKNTVIIQDIAMTGYLIQMYQSAVASQEVMTGYCNSQNTTDPATIYAPEIPAFTCPAVVSIPAGPEWQQLVSASKDFDKNNLNIKKTDKPVPNVSVAISAGNMLSQPGIAPYLKTANGSITTGLVNDGDDGLTPLPKIEKDWDLTPLPKLPMDELTPLPDLRKSKLAKELMQKMMTADCNGVKTPKQNLKDQLDRMMKKVKELEAYEQMMEQIKKLESQIEQKEADAQKKEQLKQQLEKLQKAADELDNYEELAEKRKNIDKIIKEMDAMDDKKILKDNLNRFQQLVDEMENAPVILKDIQQNGLQPTINSSLQAPGMFNFVKGLFQ